MTDFPEWLEEIPDELLERLRFTVPWQLAPESTNYVDPDRGSSEVQEETREQLQEECLSKFYRNPQVNTSVRGLAGRMTGLGFATTSSDPRLLKIIEDTELDWRNRLYNYWPKFTTRAIITGELFLLLSIHPDGFIEVDYLDCSDLMDGNGSKDGVFWHERKRLLPVAYNIRLDETQPTCVIPSIYVARDPSLMREIEGGVKLDAEQLRESRTGGRAVNGFTRFVVAWDRGILTRRGISYLRTVVEWLNHYETIKKYEIDHKKSAASFVWAIEMIDLKTFRTWLSLPDSERRKTGITAKKVPGTTLILPPGMKLVAVAPQLPKISENDSDILQMAVSGLNEPADVTLGTSKSPYASVKASRGPLSDRTSDEIAYFERFLRYDFWGSIFHLKAAMLDLPWRIEADVPIGFDNEGKLKTVRMQRRPEQLIEIDFPISDIGDLESKAKAYLGVKHGSLPDAIGIPRREIARRLGFGSYTKSRLHEALEREVFPKLMSPEDWESAQEKQLEQPKKTGQNRRLVR